VTDHAGVPVADDPSRRPPPPVPRRGRPAAVAAAAASGGLDLLSDPSSPAGRALAAAGRLEAALARLDHALGLPAGQALRPAFLHRARLEAACRHAAVDGEHVDPWRLAALVAGLPLRFDAASAPADRAGFLVAARHALDLHAWLAAPDFDQEGAVRRAEAALAGAPGATPVLAAAFGARAWLAEGGPPAPLRAALARHWTRRGLLRAPVPLAGAAALRGEDGDGASATPEAYATRFLGAVADEADAALALLARLERAWREARLKAVRDRRGASSAGRAVDLLAAAPLLSTAAVAASLGVARNNAAALLGELCRAGVAVEVTRRARGRLFGLAGLAPLRDEVAPPRRPVPGRGRGRPPRAAPPGADAPEPPVPDPPAPAPLAPWAFDYGELDRAMAAVDALLRRARRDLGVSRSEIACAPPAGRTGRHNGGEEADA
jgi:hypothetical protein